MNRGKHYHCSVYFDCWHSRVKNKSDHRLGVHNGDKAVSFKECTGDENCQYCSWLRSKSI